MTPWGRLDVVLVAVRQESQEASAFDSGVELALIDGTGASQTRRNDFAVFSDEVAQQIDVFVVDLLNARDGEAAEALAFEQGRLGVALRAVFVERFFTKTRSGSHDA